MTNKEPIYIFLVDGTWRNVPGVSISSVPGLNIPMMRVTGAQEYNKTMTASNPVPVIRTPGVLNIKSANGKSWCPINSIAFSFSFQTSLLRLINICCHTYTSRFFYLVHNNFAVDWCVMCFMANVSAGSVIVWGVPRGLSPLFPLDNWSQGSQKQQNRFILKQKSNSYIFIPMFSIINQDLR